MNLEDQGKKVETEWYNHPTIVTNCIIGLIAVIIILSQSYAVNHHLSTSDIFISIFNHNSIYLLSLVYFVFLKFSFGKKYFNYLNVFLILLYFLIMVTSLLTVFQSFSLTTLLSFAIHIILFVYLFHTFFRGTRVWKEFNLQQSPFNEISNDGYFYSVMILSIIFLAVNLISAVTFDGVILSLLDCFYVILFSRYVYLYRVFMDRKEKVGQRENLFDVEKVVDTMHDVGKKVENFVEDVHLDQAIDNVTEMVSDLKEEVVSQLSKKDTQGIKKKKVESQKKGNVDKKERKNVSSKAIKSIKKDQDKGGE